MDMNSFEFSNQIDNKKIIFIASYPKSGNTWLRAIICSLIFSQNNSFSFEILKNIGLFSNINNFNHFKNKKYQKNGNFDFNWVMKHWIKAQKIINKNSNKEIFFKTHNVHGVVNNYFFTDESVCLGFIYIVRDPRDVSISLANHMGITYDQSIEEMLFNEKHMTSHNRINEFVSTWKNNVSSWIHYKKVNRLILKYEDLVTKPKESIHQIAEFLSNITTTKIDMSKKNINKIISSTNFKNLKKLEFKNGFNESSAHSNFFRKGISGNWKKELSIKQSDLIEKKLGQQMQQLLYL